MKLNILNNPAPATKQKGVIVASLFVVDKVKGFSLKFKSQTRNEKNELVDITGQELMQIHGGDSMLCLPNNRKREGKRDPAYLVYATPQEEVPTKE